MSNPQTIDPKLLSFAQGEAQLRAAQAVLDHGGFAKAAKALGINQSNVSRAITRLRAHAATRGYSPDHDYTRAVPETHVAVGVSSYYNEDGVLTGQWVKSKLDDEKLAAAKQAVLEAMAEDIVRLRPITPAPGPQCARLANVYTLTDSHVGMLAWGEEAGEPWDLKIAEDTLTSCFEQMVLRSPRAAVAFINQLGDFLHYDSAVAAVTPLHGHNLDADGRMPKMVKIAIRILRRVIDMALLHHERVVVLLAEGNHDMSSSVWLRAMFQALYENEPRVEVIESALPYYCYQHGATMLAFHHGHLKKNDQLPLTFAAQFPKIWGATTRRYCHTGHRHHTEEKEHSGMTVFQHPTLAARDAYAARGGWIADRRVTAVTYHRDHGEVGRTSVTPDMAR